MIKVRKTTITPLNGNMLHVKFGNESEDFTNIYADLKQLDVLIDSEDIVCHNCCGKLSAADDLQLSHQVAPGIKTKTRVGDIWDKNGIEPVRNGKYDGDSNYQNTRTEKANKERLKVLRKSRNISQDRSPGKRIDAPTDTRYSRRDKGDTNR